MKRLHAILIFLCAISLAACHTVSGTKGLPTTDAEKVAALDRHYAKISAASGDYGDGGAEVLRTAYDTLRAGKVTGKWPLVGLADLWAESLKEAGGMMQTDRRWGVTTAAETKDLIGQTTIGPWQLTINNVKNVYGRSYGIDPAWSDAEVYEFIRGHPEIQAAMACDLIQKNYEDYGVRGPYAIQSYFWLQAFLDGNIGQGAWDKSVLAVAPDGDYRHLTPEQKRDTGFYAKQLLLGNHDCPKGLLYWLAITGNEDTLRAALREWRTQRKWLWDDKNHRVSTTQDAGDFAIHPEDLKYMKPFPEQYALANRIVGEVLAERGTPATAP